MFVFPKSSKLLSSYWVLGLFILTLIVPEPLNSQAKIKQIEIIQADRLLGKREGQEFEKLIGDVVLKHDSVFLYCDSAYRFKDINEVIAYGHVKLNQGDTLFLYADTLYYEGNTSKSRARQNVLLIDPSTRLNTDFLDADFNTNISYFFNGGTIRDSANTLISQEGFYFGDTHDLNFISAVDLQTPDYLCKSDTLFYNTDNGIARFFGPTEIFNDTSYLYGKIGYYHTQLDVIQLGKDCYIEKEEWIIEADSIFVNEQAGFGKAMQNVLMEDTLQQILVAAHYVFFDENKSYSLATDSAVFMQYQDRDTLYLHADSLLFREAESGSKLMQAYHNVRFFRYDMQGKCDSLAYLTNDSIIEMYREPILWNAESQLTAEFMKIHIKNQKANKIDLIEKAFIVTKQDSLHYDQISGKNMLGHIKNNVLYRIDVDGNAQTIYFPYDEKDIMGMNSAESSNLIIWIDQGQVIKISFINSPEGLMVPRKEIKVKDSFLKGFQWWDFLRPHSRKEIFLRTSELILNETKESEEVNPTIEP